MAVPSPGRPYGTGAYGVGPYGTGVAGGPGPTPDPGGGGAPSPVPVPNPDPETTGSPFDPQLLLVGTNGDEIRLRIDSDEDFGALNGATGFGIPQKILTMNEGAADGGVVRYTRTGVRELDIPVGIFGKSRGEVLRNQRRLAAALRTRPGRPAARFRFTTEDGETVEIVVHYVTGAETQIGSDGRVNYCKWLLTLRCPDPFWTSVTEKSLLVAGTGQSKPFLPNLRRMPLGSSQVFGAVTVTNPGDVPSDLVWQITGPGAFAASIDTGEGFSLADLADGETIVVDTSTGSVRDLTGANRYSQLGEAPKLFQLPDGRSRVEIEMAGAGPKSRVVGTYRVRREVVY